MKKRVSKNVVFLGLVSFFNDVASEMLYPIIPIFLTAVLGAPVFIVGIIEGIAESVAHLLKLVSGYVSDRVRKRKIFVIAGYVCSALAKPILALAYTWPIVLIARFVDRSGKGVRTSARDALIADSSTKDTSGVSFGFHRALDTLGAVVGPLFLLLLLSFIADFREIFWIAIIPSIIGIVLLVFFVKEKIKKVGYAGPVQLNIKQFNRQFRIFLLISCIFALGNSSDIFLILRTKSLGFSLTMVILAYIVYNSTYAALSYPAGFLADRFGKKHVIGIGFIIFGAVYIGFAILEAKYIWMLFAIYGFYMAFIEGVSKAYISDIVPSEKTGTAIGVFYTLTGSLTLAASIIAGFLWSYISPSATFLYGTALALLSAILIYAIPDKKSVMI